MLYHLLVPLADDISIFNVFRYITLRCGAAVLTALIISFIMGPRIIAWLRSRQRGGQPIRSDGPASHLLTKQGTPTMGGSPRRHGWLAGCPARAHAGRARRRLWIWGHMRMCMRFMSKRMPAAPNICR